MDETIVKRVINGNLYVARFKGMAYAFSLREIMRKPKTTYQVTEMLYDDILVYPEVCIDDFKTLDELEDVRMFLLEIALGNVTDKISDTRLKKQVNDEMQCWRLIFSDISTFDYNTVFYQMTPIEIRKANLALDRVYKEMKKKTKTK